METSRRTEERRYGVARAGSAQGLGTSVRRRRRTKVDQMEDPLPEHAQYQDSGCEVAPACLACPLPVCRYEVHGGLAALLRRPRDEEVLARRRGGESIEDLCRAFNLSRRTVFRILAIARDEGQR